MKTNERMRKVFSILLCLCMVLQYVPTTAFAVTTAEDGLCDHHTEHTAECGYVEAVAGQPCAHEHSETCYAVLACVHEQEEHDCTVESGCVTMALDCHHTHDGSCGYSEGTAEVPCGHTHNESCGYVEAVAEVLCACAETDESGALIHTEGCGYVAPVAGVACNHTEHTDCGYAAASEGTPCTHTHSVIVGSDASCYDLLCSHKDGGHDDTCGYVAAVEAHECHYECAECAAALTADENTESSTETTPVCDCGTDDPAIHATNCAVYVRPANPVCYCAEKCTEANVWCDVCGFDITRCGGTDTATVYGTNGYDFMDYFGLTFKFLDPENKQVEVCGYIGETADVTISTTVTDNAGVEYTVTSIGDSAFSGCTFLTSVSISNGITTIGNNAFSGCISLESVTIPSSVNNIGSAPFKGCTSLKTITVDSDNTSYSSEINNTVLLNKAGTELICYAAGADAESCDIPSSVTQIADSAFYGCRKLKSVTIPDGVTTIGANAFNGCSALTSITIPSSVTTIGDGAFKGTGATCATHRFTNSADCDVCDFTCSHTSYKDGVCTLCGIACPHTGGTATCKELAVCDTCGSAYGKLAAHTPVADSYTDKGDGNHSFTCSVCGTVTEAHSFGTGNACVCGLTITVYNLWVSGTQVTSAKASDVLGEADEGAAVTYDAATNTLTLNGANLTGGYNETVIYSSESLNVALAAGSANTLSGQNYGIRVEGDVLTISGTGSLTSTANFDGIQGKSVTISGGSITASGSTSYGIKGSTVAISGGTVTAYGGAHGVEGELILSGDTHVTITSGNNAVNGSLSNATTGWCRGGNDETFTTTITSLEGNKYFEYIGASHVTYTNKDAQNHTVACAHGISFDAAHEYESGVCACGAFSGTLDLSQYAGKEIKIYADGFTVDGGAKTPYTGDYTLTGNVNNCSVTIEGGDHNIILNNVTINEGKVFDWGDYGIKIAGGSTTLTLVGTNTITTNGQGGSQMPIWVAENATLTIGGDGVLNAINGRDGKAAIGAAWNYRCGTINITGGTINATGGGNGGSVIGQSGDKRGYGNINISGGVVNCTLLNTSGDATAIGGSSVNIAGAIVTGTVMENATVINCILNKTVCGDYTLSQDLQIAENDRFTVSEGATLTIAEGVTLTNLGVIVNYGTITGNLDNQGIVYNMGTLPTNVADTIYEQYVMVNSGSGDGNYAEGSTVTITADAPENGKMFVGWTVELGTITLADSTKATTTFTMPAGCVIVKANYADIVATITDSNGNVTSYKDCNTAINDWSNVGGTLTVYSDIHATGSEIPANGILDLNGHTMNAHMLRIDQSCTIQNGTVLQMMQGEISNGAEVVFKNVTLSKTESAYNDVQITNNGTIVDAGLTLNGVIISGGTTKTGLTENRVTLSGIPDGGYVFDGNAHEPTVKYNDVALVKGTDYTVTFSNSSGGDSTTNAGTVTMTITGTGSYAGTVTKTYTIGKVTPTMTPPAAVSGLVYSGEALTLINAGSTTGGTLMYKVGNGEWSAELPKATDAGEYTVSYKVNGNDNYNDVAEKSFTVSIGPKNVTITGKDTTVTYNGEDIDLRTLFTIDQNAGEADYSIIDLTGDGNVTSAPYLYNVTKTGTFTVLLTTAANGNYAAGEATAILTVNKPDAAVTTAPTANNRIYDGGAQALVAEGTTADGTLMYKLGEDGTYSETIPTAANAGTYTVYYYVKGDSNHNDSAAQKIEVTIGQLDITGKTVDITLAGSLTYDGAEQTMGVSSVKLDVLTVTYTVSGNTGTNADSYVLTVTGTGNFKGTATKGWSIAQKPVTVTAKDQTITYGESISGSEVSAAGLVDGHSVTATLTPSTANVTVNGTITASAAVIAADGTDVTANYDISYTSGKLVIEPDTSKIDVLTTDNVTSANEEDIKAVQAMMASAETDGIDEATAAQWAAITANCEDLIDKIEAVEAENARIADAAADFDLNTVKSSDEAAITALIADIDEQLATNNLTDEERSELEGLKTKCNNLIAKIDGTETLIGQLDKTVDDLDAETVKSTDKAALEQVIADAQTLIDSGNVTETEKEALKQTQEDAKALIKVIDDTAAENKALTDQAATFDEDTVKSTNKAELEQLAQDIEDLLDTQNLTEDERTALEAVLEQVEGMIDTINETAEDSKTATDTIGALDAETVTSDDQEEIEQAIATIDELLQSDHLTEEERAALEDAKADAEALLDVIEAAQDATDTENTEKVEDVTAENVKPEDKEALEDAKADLEKALEDNAGNYTEEEKKAIEDEIQRIEDAITALENVQDVTETITQLPETVEPDDEETAEKILDAKKAYDELTDHEKSLVDETTKEKLDGLVAALTDYKIIKGNGGKWTKGSSYGLSFTANGPFSKFVGIEVDGKEVDEKYYEAKAGSTIITLKQSFLKRLSTGEHTITVLYTDGEASGTFKILAQSTSPATGDDSNMLLWTAMLFMSVAAIAVLFINRKRFAYKAKYTR